MPLLKKQPFIRKEIPKDLKDEDEVFFCALTKEIFIDYEEFFERVIVCNSLVWTCSISGRFGLTYQEALDSEEKALKCLESFPESLQKPILYIASLTHRGTLNDMCDDVFLFARDRYFVGETIQITSGSSKKMCNILKVISPTKDEVQKNIKNSYILNPNEANDKVFHPHAHLYRYIVKEMNLPNSKSFVVKAHNIGRPKGMFTRVKNKLFLKQHTMLNNRIRVIKPDWIKRYHLDQINFADLFAADLPEFSQTPSKKSSSDPANQDESEGKVIGNYEDEDSPSGTSGKSQKKSTLLVSHEHSNDNINDSVHEEELEIQKVLEAERKRHEREQEKEKKKEEQRLKLEHAKAWSKPRDDLECDDLRSLPVPDSIPTSLTAECFGDVLTILEFVHVFGDLLDAGENFPDGLTFAQVEQAILGNESNGTYLELLQFLLASIFHLQSGEEHSNEFEEDTEEMIEELKNHGELVKKATLSSGLSLSTFGQPLRDMAIDAPNVTEILRLHLLGSGGLAHQKNALYRYQQRGSYVPRDDPGLELKMMYPEIIGELEFGNVFDLSPAYKTKVICTLINQLLTFVTLREFIEDNLEKVRLTKINIRSVHNTSSTTTPSNTNATNSTAPNSIPTSGKNKDETSNIFSSIADNKESASKDHDRKAETEDLAQVLDKCQYGGSTTAVGRDRCFRRYWLLSALPGLFVEDMENEPGSCVDKPTPQPRSPRIRNDSEPTVPNGTARGHVGDGCDEDVIRDLVLDLVRLAEDAVGSQEPEPGIKVEPGVEPEPKIKTEPGIEPEPTGPEREAETLRESSACTADEPATCSVHGVESISLRSRIASTVPLRSCPKRLLGRLLWGVYRGKTSAGGEDHYTGLLNGLNKRGFRERAFRSLLTAKRPKIVERMNAYDTVEVFGPETRNEVREQEGAGFEARRKNRSWEKDFADVLLDLEDRVFVSGLGRVAVLNRAKWRTALEDGEYQAPIFGEGLDDLVLEQVHTNEETRGHAPKTTRYLAQALIQVATGIETRFLQSPLGEDEITKQTRLKSIIDANLKNGSDSFDCISVSGFGPPNSTLAPPTPLYARWEGNVLSCTNLSQLYMHCLTLDHCISWAKSLLKVRCKVCRKKSNPEQLLLCDGCNKGHHTFCVKPKIRKIPVGDWFCPSCKKTLMSRPPPTDPATYSRVPGGVRTINGDDDTDDVITINDVDADDVTGGIGACLDDNSDASSSTSAVEGTFAFNHSNNQPKSNLSGRPGRHSKDHTRQLLKTSISSPPPSRDPNKGRMVSYLPNQSSQPIPNGCWVCGGDKDLTSCPTCSLLIHHPQCSVSLDATNMGKKDFGCPRCESGVERTLNRTPTANDTINASIPNGPITAGFDSSGATRTIASMDHTASFSPFGYEESLPHLSSSPHTVGRPRGRGGRGGSMNNRARGSRGAGTRFRGGRGSSKANTNTSYFANNIMADGLGSNGIGAHIGRDGLSCFDSSHGIENPLSSVPFTSPSVSISASSGGSSSTAYSRSGRKIKRSSRYDDDTDLNDRGEPGVGNEGPLPNGGGDLLHGRKRTRISDEWPRLTTSTTDQLVSEGTPSPPHVVARYDDGEPTKFRGHEQHSSGDDRPDRVAVSQSRGFRGFRQKRRGHGWSQLPGISNGRGGGGGGVYGGAHNGFHPTKQPTRIVPDLDAGSESEAATKTFSRSHENSFNRDQRIREEIVQNLKKHADSWPFLKPVSKMKVPDYYTIVREPMDLGTIKAKVDDLRYPTMQSFITDVRLIFHNCWLYNQDHTPEYRAAQSLELFFQRRLKEFDIEFRLDPDQKSLGQNVSGEGFNPSRTNGDASTKQPVSCIVDKQQKFPLISLSQHTLPAEMIGGKK